MTWQLKVPNIDQGDALTSLRQESSRITLSSQKERSSYGFHSEYF